MTCDENCLADCTACAVRSEVSAPRENGQPSSTHPRNTGPGAGPANRVTNLGVKGATEVRDLPSAAAGVVIKPRRDFTTAVRAAAGMVDLAWAAKAR